MQESLISEKKFKKLENRLISSDIEESTTNKFINLFRSIRQVYSLCCSSVLDENHRAVTDNFGNCWQELFEDPKVNLSWTPKAHQIAHHFSDCFEDSLVKGQSLGVSRDQVIEHMHSYINRMMSRSFYKLKNFVSETAAKKQHAEILKINSVAKKIKPF